jgi:hypothetical protein
MSAAVMERTNSENENSTMRMEAERGVLDLIAQYEDLAEAQKKAFSRFVLRKVFLNATQKMAIRDEDNTLLGYIVPTPSISDDEVKAVVSRVPEYQPNGKPTLTHRDLMGKI